MKKVLLKDIVIPAGTVFNDAPTSVSRTPGAYVEAVIGLTDDTAGFVTYDVDKELDGIWFADLKE